MLFRVQEWSWDDFAAWAALCIMVAYMALSTACHKPDEQPCAR